MYVVNTAERKKGNNTDEKVVSAKKKKSKEMGGSTSFIAPECSPRGNGSASTSQPATHGFAERQNIRLIRTVH